MTPTTCCSANKEVTVNPKEKVLACVDQSTFADYVADYAAWAARRMDAPLQFLHIIDRHQEPPSGEDHSGAIGFDAQEQLLNKLSSEDEARTRAARERGRLFLNRLRERASAAGVAEVDIRQRYGELVETLLEQEEGVRLMVLGRRGEAAETTQRDLGRNVERVVRGLHRPILAVTEGFREPERIMIAFDGGVVTRRGVQMVSASPLFRGLPIHLLMSGKPTADASRKLSWAEEKLSSAGFEVSAKLVSGDAETVIAKSSQDEGIDLLIMGAFSHSPLRSLLFGSKTADLLRASGIPTLLLR
ncbi:MAG: nucleotide-binding universal stress UspA family protein [Halieaceae bacterium]|jgi:nucleotide-binding universal stress UspA family protein